jgi:hypothetical protein
MIKVFLVPTLPFPVWIVGDRIGHQRGLVGEMMRRKLDQVGALGVLFCTAICKAPKRAGRHNWLLPVRAVCKS